MNPFFTASEAIAIEPAGYMICEHVMRGAEINEVQSEPECGVVVVCAVCAYISSLTGISGIRMGHA